MESFTNIGIELLTALFVAVGVMGVAQPFREGYLFDKWGWTIAIQDKWWSNPLFLCPYCMSPWYGLATALILGTWFTPVLAIGFVAILKRTE